ncbi:hypothetical protein K490DRAFT_74515 [Saccharata proteae CBS 121410]|uniref:Uncharacterized protein n=1 Tax=Saccharata proteae CBS 121410 TaxID=1314787 RepID=A0A9P4HW05_9PEZI|nr:hypothetical protein K490DRAFT_74515 [Saccharata proteae CBS 121410]
MATTTNGALTPSPPPHEPISSPESSTTTKRKRDLVNSNAHQKADAVSTTRTGQHVDALLRDVRDILKSYDATTAILDHTFSTDETRSLSGEPSAKRTKLAQPGAETTINANIDASAYTSLDELAQDVRKVCAQIRVSTASQSPPAQVRLEAAILAFEKALKNIIIRESQRNPSVQSADFEHGEPSINGAAKVKAEVVDDEMDLFSDSKSVLTLFASAQGNKQLFSSLQQPVRVGGVAGEDSSNGLDTSVKVTVPLNEIGLPNMISTTKIVPAHTETAVSGQKAGPTFGEVFGPPPKFRELKAPMPASQSAARGSTVVWGPPEFVSKSSRRGSAYASQKLSTADWLSYGGLDVSKEPNSPSAKRKQRDRALSTGEVNPPPSEEALAAAQKAKADALFRSVYSTFAPSRDDGVAVIPEETKNQVWWKKIGEKRFHQAFVIDPALFDAQPGEAMEESNEVDEVETFKEAAECFEPEELNIPNSNSVKKTDEEAKHDKDVEEILRDISELLETLYSYQRIRYTTLAPSSRTPATQDNSPNPMTPSSGEIDVYKMLKDQLSLMISQLPPYAVAKLNGDQLAELNISRNIVIETPEYRGVMEEDQVSKLAKSAAISAAAGATPIPRPVSATHSYAPAVSQYSRTPSQPFVSGAKPAASYYPQQQPPQRSPSIHYPRTSTAQPYQTPSAYTARPTYAATQAYGQQTPRPTAYGQTPAAYAANPQQQQYYTPRPSQQPYGQYYQAPQSQVQGRYAAPAAAAYPPRQPTAPLYSYTAQSPSVRTASPLKSGAPAYAPSRPPSASAPYATPSAGPHQRSYYQPGPPPASQPYGSQAPPGAPATPVGPSGYHTSMTAQQEAAMVRGAYGQVQAQQQARLQAQSITRQGSGTPQPPAPEQNGGYGGGASGTPVVAQ